MKTRNPRIACKIQMDSVVNKFQNSYKARFAIGDYIINNFFHFVDSDNGKLNFKVKSCGANEIKHQVTFDDGKWGIYDIVKGQVSYRCGTIEC